MPIVQAVAIADSRVALIRRQLSVLPPAGGARTRESATRTATDVPAFEPFGSVYQAALGGITAAPSATSDPPGFEPAIRPTRVERTEARATTRATSSNGDGGSMSGTDVARVAYDAGFRGDDLVAVVAIAQRESSWNPSAFNGNSATGDRSYGLMQINMLGDLGGARLREFGITDEHQLLDPQTNMDAAFTLYQRSGGTLNAWGGYKGRSNTFDTDLGAAAQVVADAGLT